MIDDRDDRGLAMQTFVNKRIHAGKTAVNGKGTGN